MFNYIKSNQNPWKLLILLQTLLISNVKSACDPTHKYCDPSTLKFNSWMGYQLFEGSIALFQSGFFITSKEQRSQFLNQNPTCTAAQSQLRIHSMQQLGNNENDFDQNVNEDTLWDLVQYKESPQLPVINGNFISFQRCAFEFNFMYRGDGYNKNYYFFTRYSISIEYIPELLQKKTVFKKDGTVSNNNLLSYLGYNDLPCETTQFYFHPTIKAVMYLSQDGNNIIIKGNFTRNDNEDICDATLNVFSFTQGISQVKTMIESTGFTVTKIVDNFIFLNNQLYILAHGYETALGSTFVQSRIVKLEFTIQGPRSIPSTITNVATFFGHINQIAAFEMTGFLYTYPNSTGYYITTLDRATYTVVQSTVHLASTDTWKIYQSRVDNHMHRSIYGVNSSQVSAIHRLTSVQVEQLYDSTHKTDFYNYDVQFTRYHAIVNNPGTCAQDRSTTNFNNMKVVLLNLRRMEVEKCLEVSLIGCGDGIYKASNAEQCDDNNLNDGDGCSRTCQIEGGYQCTQVEGQTSGCTEITCGNGRQDAGEECDDSNNNDGDGCNANCIIEAGYDCQAFTSCTNMCGDGEIFQQMKTYANGTQYVFYTEECDMTKGCNNATCTKILGWNCSQDLVAKTSSCVQTCGNNKHETWEVCDDGNNVGGDGCAQGCMEVEFPYQCPLVGKCTDNCGNGLFEGRDPSINLLVAKFNEECDDGNYLDGDGCSTTCEIETGWTCVNKYQQLSLELPAYKSFCTQNGGGGGSTQNFEIRRDIRISEYIYDDYSVDIERLTGRFRLIEHPKNLSLFGVSMVTEKFQYSSNGQDFYNYEEYTKVRQLENNNFTYYETKISSASNMFVSNQRGFFGQFYIRNSNSTSLEFYGFLPQNTNDIVFKKFYDTESMYANQLLGNHEIIWWPEINMTMARYINGYNWKGFKMNENVVDIALGNIDFERIDWIESGFTRETTLEGKIELYPIFWQNYIVTYSHLIGVQGGVFRVHKYLSSIDYLVPFNEEKVFSEPNKFYSKYSMVFFGEEFGIAFKQFNSSNLYRLQLPYLNTTSITFNYNGYAEGQSLENLTMIQRRQDPYFRNETRDVYGYFDNTTIYKIEADLSDHSLKIVDAIPVRPVYTNFHLNKTIDIGKNHIALYSQIDCDAVPYTSRIVSGSVWFYTFELRDWQCMNVNSQNYPVYDLDWPTPSP